MKELAFVTVFFDYPQDAQPIASKNLAKYGRMEDLFVARFSGLPQGTSYYEKLTTYKVDYLLPYIQENILGKYEYTLFFDATDVNLFKDPSGIIKDFKTFDADIVFNGERELWPATSKTHLYSEKQILGPARYLNSGLYIGTTEKIVEHLDNLIKGNDLERITDQAIWANYYLEHPEIKLDQKYKLFFSTHKAKEYVDIEEGPVCLRGISPYLIHDNGPYSDETIKITHLI